MITIRKMVAERIRRVCDWYLLPLCTPLFLSARLLSYPAWVRGEVRRALAFARGAHKGQKRPGGEPQFAHVCLVALDAAREAKRLRLNAAQARDLVVAAALHDIIEDTDWDHYDLSVFFGIPVADIVRAVSHEEEEESDEIYLRRVVAGGFLAVLVKLIDRLVNLRGLRYMQADFRARKCAEIRESLPIWESINPRVAGLIEELLREVEHVSTAR